MFCIPFSTGKMFSLLLLLVALVVVVVVVVVALLYIPDGCQFNVGKK